jgi:NAD/NADP transhydrogenase alpha subunit
MQVGVPKETYPGERRVALSPDNVARLTGAGLAVAVETDAGAEAGFTDAAYRDAGATISDSPAALLPGSDIVLKVRPPSHDGPDAEVGRLKAGSTLIALLQPLT